MTLCGYIRAKRKMAQAVDRYFIQTAPVQLLTCVLTFPIMCVVSLIAVYQANRDRVKVEKRQRQAALIASHENVIKFSKNRSYLRR